MSSIETQGNDHKVAGTQEMKTFEFTVKAIARTKVDARSEKEAWAKLKRMTSGAAINKSYITAISTSEKDVLSVEKA